MFLPVLCLEAKFYHLGLYYYILSICFNKLSKSIVIDPRDIAKRFNYDIKHVLLTLNQMESMGMVSLVKNRDKETSEINQMVIEVEDQTVAKILDFYHRQEDGTGDGIKYEIDLDDEEMAIYKAIKRWRDRHYGRECPTKVLEEIDKEISNGKK